MFNIPNNDPTALQIHLNELKTLFDRAICEGKNFEQVKQIYLQIKELECQLSVIQWQGTTKNVGQWTTGNTGKQDQVM